MHFVKLYLNHHTNRVIRQICFKDRRHSSPSKKIIDVYPQIIVDVPEVSLNRIQLDYLHIMVSSKLYSINDVWLHYLIFILYTFIIAYDFKNFLLFTISNIKTDLSMSSIRDLKPGQTYQVIKQFIDYDDIVHSVGEM
jgi:hypothetical protein